MRNILLVLVVLCFVSVPAQELNCNITINFDRVTNTNPQIFKNLETALNEFINSTKWTNLTLKQNERIECAMFINVSEFTANTFTASLQVQATRPVFNSLYASSIFNFNDKEFSFKYVEFENLFFNPNSFDSNLVAVLAYYAYVILGIDADTYTLKGGTPYFEQAQAIVSIAQTGGYKGWSQSDGLQSRYFLVSDLLSNTFDPIRETQFQYHATGLDRMADNLKEGKEAIKAALLNLESIHQVRPNAFLTRVFFDTKTDEIISVFSGGPSSNSADLVAVLNRISPLNASKWSALKR